MDDYMMDEMELPAASEVWGACFDMIEDGWGEVLDAWCGGQEY